MVAKSEIRCRTPRCVERVRERGENCHDVYERTDAGYPPNHYLPGTVAECGHCGGHTDGVQWRHRCRRCGTDVEPGFLTGLFVPSRCVDCQKAMEEEDRSANRRCRGCRALSINCCC
jgi:hypothetical protein